jgi:YfiH family protein
MSDLELLTAEGFGDDRIIHVFTTRTGGVSEGPYESLNLSWSRGDDKAAVAENRRRVADAMGGVTLVFANQVHGDAVLRVDEAPQGRWSAGEGDALMTDKPGLALCAQTADCTPVLLFDPEHPAIAAIHAGWRGAVAEIIPKALLAMAAAYGTDPANVQAAIGPAISKENYRVGPEVLEQFEALFGDHDTGLIGPRDAQGGAGLDVAEACRRQLEQAGVASITRLARCTFAEPDSFFSSRRAGRDGHAGAFGGLAGIIALKV